MPKSPPAFANGCKSFLFLMCIVLISQDKASPLGKSKPFLKAKGLFHRLSEFNSASHRKAIHYLSSRMQDLPEFPSPQWRLEVYKSRLDIPNVSTETKYAPLCKFSNGWRRCYRKNSIHFLSETLLNPPYWILSWFIHTIKGQFCTPNERKGNKCYSI